MGSCDFGLIAGVRVRNPHAAFKLEASLHVTRVSSTYLGSDGTHLVCTQTRAPAGNRAVAGRARGQPWRRTPSSLNQKGWAR